MMDPLPDLRPRNLTRGRVFHQVVKRHTPLAVQPGFDELQGHRDVIAHTVFRNGSTWRFEHLFGCGLHILALAVDLVRLAAKHFFELLLRMVKPLVEQLESLDRDFKYRRAGLEEGCVEIAAGGSTLRYVLPRLPPRNLSTWQVVQEAFKRQNLDCQVAMEAGGWDVIKKYVELGLGISIISSVGITGQDKVEVIPASQFFPKRVYGVVMRRNNALSPQAMRFVELLLHGKGNDADPAQQG